MSNTLLKTIGLTKKYGDFAALSGVSLTLNEGEIYGLIGRNGAGKTTFFKCIMGLASVSSGQVEIAGGKNLLEARKQIGFMINPAFFPYLNAAQNLTYLCRVRNLNPKNEVERLLRLVDLYGVKKPFKKYSLGMKQRLGLAGALLGTPPIVVLDEPINGLDPQGIADIRSVLQRENKEHGVTFIVSSHILTELDLVATKFGFIEKGQLVQEISHTQLHQHTKKSLLLDTSNPARALEILAQQGIAATQYSAYGLVLETTAVGPAVISRLIVENGLDLYRITPQETTLEEYFIKLVGGSNV